MKQKRECAMKEGVMKDERRASCSGHTYIWVFMLSNGVTASKDSVAPAPKPAMTVRGPETLPSASARRVL